MATIFMKRAEEPRAEVDGKPMEPGPTPNQKRSEQFVDDAISWARRTRAFPLQEFQSMQRFAQELDSVALPPGALCNFGAKIGQGAFGMIRRAELDGRVVAVKNLEGSRSDGPVNDIMYKARNELEILREVHHPNIVAFLGTSASFPAATQPVGAWKIAFVMELCERGDLNQLMHKDKVPFSFSEKVSMARDTACALAYLHKHKIFHRDLCSRNLLLMTDGRVKICDFGCARIMKRFSFQPNFILGSVSWMSPEQVKGKPIGMQSDLYSFGMIMWELATEMQPFNNCEGLNFAQLQDVVAMVRKRTPNFHEVS
jgi:serine/threonine protein kinase